MKNSLAHIARLALIVALLPSCEKYFGDKTNLDFIDVPDYSPRQVAYVPIQPVLSDFVKPVDIAIGFDELIYIVDEGAEEVVCMDQAGKILGRKKVQGATNVAQDRRFDLLVTGTKDTTINGVENTFAAVYRLRLAGSSGYGINNAEIVNTTVHPFYFKNSFSTSDKLVRFNGIGVIADNANPEINNRYYVTRSGVSTSSLNPDDAVLLFSNEDEHISNVSVTTSNGQLFGDYFEEPSGIVTLAQPPQVTAQSGGDFIYTSLEPGNALKVQYIEFIESEFGAEYNPKILASGDTSKADGFINTPGKFENPTDIALAGDASRYIFVIDEAKDSLFQFNFAGFEGVQPPAATGITKLQKVSFGGTGNGLTQFRNPTGVAYFDEILYVADAGNGRVLRFKLTLDFD